MHFAKKHFPQISLHNAPIIKTDPHKIPTITPQHLHNRRVPPQPPQNRKALPRPPNQSNLLTKVKNLNPKIVLKKPQIIQSHNKSNGRRLPGTLIGSFHRGMFHHRKAANRQ
jgi:hypothetical protein